MKKLFLLLILVISQIHLSFSQNETEELVTDRPDQTESTYLVPAGALQIELGAVFETDKAEGITYRNNEYGSMLLRYGLNKNIELRLAFGYGQDKVEEADLSDDVSGFRPFSPGVKLFISEQHGILPRTVFIGHLELPLGDDEFTPEHVTSSFLLAFSNDVSDNFGIGYSTGISWSDNGNYETFYSLVGGMGLSDKLGAYLEFYGYLPNEGENQHLFDAGFTYLLKSNLQLDLSGGIGLSDVAPDYFIGLGVTLRIPN